MDGLKLFIPITKVDVAKRLVFGVATAEQVDRAGEICDYASTKPLYQKWSDAIFAATDGKSLGNVRAMHGSVAAGKLTELAFNDDDKQIEVCAKVVDDAEWNKVTEGVYTGFSQGGNYVERWKDDDSVWHYTAEPVEISLVDLPCLPSATFSFIKADGMAEDRHFATVATQEAPVNPTSQQVAVKAQELAKAAGNESAWPTFIEAATAELTKAPPAPETAVSAVALAAAVAAPAVAAAAVAEPAAAAAVVEAVAEPVAAAVAEKAATPTGVAELPAAGEIRQVWLGADGVPFSKKDDARAHAATLAKGGGSALELALANVDAAIAGKPVAAPALSTAEALAAAIAAYPGLTKGQQVARRAIVKAAFALGTEATLPADMYVAGPKPDMEVLAKNASLYDVSTLLGILASIESIEECIEYDSVWYGTNVSDDLKTRFGALLIEFGDITASVLDSILEAMKAEESSEALQRAAGPLSLFKAGARHNRGDKALLKTAHDSLVKLGAECTTEKGAGGELAKGVEAGDLGKQVESLMAKNTEMSGLLEKATAAMNTAAAELTKRGEDVDALRAEVAKLAAQPTSGGPARLNVIPENVTNALSGAEKAAAAGDMNGVVDNLIKASQSRPLRAMEGHVLPPFLERAAQAQAQAAAATAPSPAEAVAAAE